MSGSEPADARDVTGVRVPPPLGHAGPAAPREARASDPEPAASAPAPISDESSDDGSHNLTARLLRRLGLSAVGLVVLALTLVGVLTITRGTPVERVVALGPNGESARAPAVFDSLFARTMALYTGTALQAGTAVEVLADGDGTYPLLWRDLRAARQSITAQLYYSMPGAVADTFAAVLAERARAGVRVLLVLDAFGSQSLAGTWSDSLRATGVEVTFLRRLRWYKLDRATSRSHVRAVVVDGLVGYTGGFGLADYWLGDGRRDGEWRETNVRFQGPAVAQLQAAFATAWAEATGELLTGAFFFPDRAFAAAGGAQAALLFTAPPKGSTAAERFLALSIAAARRTLYIANGYFVPDEDFSRLLCEARGRGVDVRVLVPSTNIDVRTVYFASRARYPALLACGVRLFEYQPAMMHAKTLVVDGEWAAVGSMNFDNRSLALNNESNLVVLDRDVGATMDAMFLEDLRFAREITARAFAERPWWHRVLEGGATLLSRVL